MPKIGLKLGLTIPGPQQYSSLKPEIEISDIDADGDVDAQIAAALAALAKLYEAGEQQLAQEAANMGGLAIEGLGLATELKEFKAGFEEFKAHVVIQVKELKAKVAALTPHTKE